jgi:hypothetical protein
MVAIENDPYAQEVGIKIDASMAPSRSRNGAVLAYSWATIVARGASL